MGILINHWHCLIPAISIIAALFLMRNKDEISSEKKNKNKEGVGNDTDSFDSR